VLIEDSDKIEAGRFGGYDSFGPRVFVAAAGECCDQAGVAGLDFGGG